MQFVQRFIADQVRPSTSFEPPTWFIDQNGHTFTLLYGTPILQGQLPSPHEFGSVGVNDSVDHIRAAWVAAVGEQSAQLDQLIAAYSQPNRRYHSVTHIAWVLRHLNQLSHHPLPTTTAAALYHDVIYDPRSATNEADSADLASQQLADIGWTPGDIQRVATMIMATAGHAPTDDAELAALLDADLAVLGSQPASYLVYVGNIRAEYAHVAQHDWRVGRSMMLRSFLDRTRIFSTDAMYVRRELAARRNLASELAALQ